MHATDSKSEEIRDTRCYTVLSCIKNVYARTSLTVKGETRNINTTDGFGDALDGIRVA